MGAFEVDADEVVTPSHIDDGDEDAVLVDDGYLRFRWRKARSHEQQPRQRLVGRLSAAVDQLSVRRSCVRPRTPGCSCGHRLDIADLDVGGVHQRIDTLNACSRSSAPADIECGASGRRDAHTVDTLRSRRPRRHRCVRRASAVAAGWCGSTRRAGPALSTSCPTSQRPTTPRRHRADATTATLLASLELPKAQRPAVCVHRDRPGRRTDAAPEPTTRRLRRLPSLETAIPILPHGRSLPTTSDTTGRLCRFVHRLRRFAYDTARSTAARRI